MERAQLLVKEIFDINHNITQSILLDELHQLQNRTIAAIQLTSTPTFLKNCTEDTISYFSILLNLSTDIKEIYQALFHKNLHSTKLRQHPRIYHINTKQLPLTLYYQLCEKTNQCLTLVIIGVNHLFNAPEDQHKFHLMLTIRDCLMQIYNVLELSMLKFPELYVEEEKERL